MDGEHFESLDEINSRLTELTSEGRLPQLAAAWKQDDPKWQAQNLAYDALEADSIEEAMWLVNKALKLDPDCTDAQRLLVSVVASDPHNKLHLMREVVEKAERNFGEDFFRSNMGSFWGMVSTRPYMRALLHLGELLVETNQSPKAVEVFERMLELNLDDNLGARYLLLGLYLAGQQTENARQLISRFSGELSASFAWARVMERWLAGALDEATAALKHARKVNPFAETYINGSRALPKDVPEYYRPGDETEARVCAKELSSALEDNPGFREWLRQQT